MRLSLVLTAVVAVAFFAILLLGAFAGPLLATPVWGAVPLSFLLGLVFIIGVVVMMVIYAAWANAADANAADANAADANAAEANAAVAGGARGP